MSKRKNLLLSAALLSALSIFAGPFAFANPEAYIEKLFDLRTAITDQGKNLPGDIKKTNGEDMRTLERIFELNTSALTTIEAYFRIFKVTITSGNDTKPEAVNILNDWLNFIANQCTYDTEYLNAALKDTRNKDVIQNLNISKKNIDKLAEIAQEGIAENNKMIKK